MATTRMAGDGPFGRNFIVQPSFVDFAFISNRTTTVSLFIGMAVASHVPATSAAVMLAGVAAALPPAGVAAALVGSPACCSFLAHAASASRATTNMRRIDNSRLRGEVTGELNLEVRYWHDRTSPPRFS